MKSLPDLKVCKVAIIGLGYVGLPLAIEIAKTSNSVNNEDDLNRIVIGYDINASRIRELRNGYDRTNEVTVDDLSHTKNINFTDNPADLLPCDVFIVTVPTPIDNAKRPNLSPLIQATELVGHTLQKQKSRNSNTSPIVIYESTVFPGATEEVCVPILEHRSGLTFNSDFFCGYSPERINPGDQSRKLASITKVTSGSTDSSATWIDSFYASFIRAGTHRATSIKVAEAAKVIENTQRDLNIALINELAVLFNLLDIDTFDVLEAAGTKWNFLPFRPGLVGGHCIGVDPYYLTHKAEEVGYHPEVILAGRRINDSMADWVAKRIVLELAAKGQEIVGSNVLILGFSFKENCPDLRNTKVIDVTTALNAYGLKTFIVDPYVDSAEALTHFSLTVDNKTKPDAKYNAVVCLVAHDQFKKMSHQDWTSLLTPDGIIFDLKCIVPRTANPIRI